MFSKDSTFVREWENLLRHFFVCLNSTLFDHLHFIFLHFSMSIFKIKPSMISILSNGICTINLYLSFSMYCFPDEEFLRTNKQTKTITGERQLISSNYKIRNCWFFLFKWFALRLEFVIKSKSLKRNKHRSFFTGDEDNWIGTWSIRIK